MQKANERYHKEKAAKNYLKNKESIKEKSKNQYKNLSEEEKDKIKKFQRKIPAINSVQKRSIKSK